MCGIVNLHGEFRISCVTLALSKSTGLNTACSLILDLTESMESVKTQLKAKLAFFKLQRNSHLSSFTLIESLSIELCPE